MKSRQLKDVQFLCLLARIIKIKFDVTLPFMDACHLLLGRLLHYDRKVLYYGYKHTYTFMVDEERLVLAPLQPSKPSPSKTKASAVVFIF